MKAAPIDPVYLQQSYDSFENSNYYYYSPYALSTVSSYSSTQSSISQSTSASSSSSSTPTRSSREKLRGLIISPEQSDYSCFLASQYVALDCEMVGVGPGGKISVLARVSVVDYYGRTLFDSFVHVEERVTDYRTHVSGVTERDLKTKGADFGRVRNRVKKLLKNKTVVGHGLENDLRALKIDRDHLWYNIRDSATQHRPYMRFDPLAQQWRPCRLRDLAWHHLGVVIQQGDKPHDSLEDARAAMALYRIAQPEWDYEIDLQRRDRAMANFFVRQFNNCKRF